MTVQDRGKCESFPFWEQLMHVSSPEGIISWRNFWQHGLLIQSHSFWICSVLCFLKNTCIVRKTMHGGANYVCVYQRLSFTWVPLVHCVIVSVLYWCRNGGWGLQACVKNHCGLRLYSLFVVALLLFVPGFGFVLFAPALHVAMTEATSRNCCGWKVTPEK